MGRVDRLEWGFTQRCFEVSYVHSSRRATSAYGGELNTFLPHKSELVEGKEGCRSDPANMPDGARVGSGLHITL